MKEMPRCFRWGRSPDSWNNFPLPALPPDHVAPQGHSMDGAPLNYLTAAGARASQISWLTWGLMLISIAVIAVITGLLLAGILRRPSTAMSEYPRAKRPAPALEWIYIGVGVSAVVLLGSAVWTMYTLAAVGGMPQDPAVRIAINGHQWWWEVRYLSSDPSEIFTTANEIHIPTGK